MRFVLIAIAMFMIFNTTFASQLLNRGYFLYSNVTVSPGDSVVIGINTSSDVDLIVIPSSEYGAYINSEPVSAVYNNTVSSGIYQLNLSEGSYTVISDALRATTLDVAVLAVPYGSGKLVNFNGRYEDDFYLSNYSDVRISLLSSSDYSNGKMSANLSGTGITVLADANLDTLNLTLNKGQQSLVLVAPQKMQLFILLNATPELVNPLAQTSLGGNYSIGVVSYGLYNISGTLYPYQIRTNEVIGVANITSLSAYEFNPPINSSVDGASLQLNVGLNTHVNGNPMVFWIQDVIDFNTSSQEYYFVDNIWNNTTPYANVSNVTLVGDGNTSLCYSCGNQDFYVDSYPVYYLNYSFPFRVKLIVLTNQTPQGSRINFGYQILRNGTYGLGPVLFFDSVLIPGSSNTTLLTTPYYETPQGGGSFGNYYDTELVFGGEASGANAYFNQLNALLWLYYNDSGRLTPFPSVYTFGLSTAESASNIAVVNSSEGALAITGIPDLSTDVFAGNSLVSVAKYISSTSNYTTSSTTTTVLTVNPFQVNSISPAEIGTFEILAGAAIIFILIVGFLLLRRR